MSKWLKVTFFTVLLIGTGYLFGRVCIQVNSAYELIFLPSKELLNLLLKFLLAVGASMLASGLVAVLIRPLWIGYIAFTFSGISLLLSWQVSVATSILVLIYILSGIVYATGVARDLNERICFSIRSVGVGQSMLSMSLALIACGSLYLGYKEHINQVGFSIPEPFMDLFIGQIETQFEMGAPEEDSTEALTELKEDLKQRVEDMIYQKLEPYEEFIPLGVAAGVFMSLVTILGILMFFPNVILGLIFSFLKAVGFVRIVSKTQEIQSLVIE